MITYLLPFLIDLFYNYSLFLLLARDEGNHDFFLYLTSVWISMVSALIACVMKT